MPPDPLREQVEENTANAPNIALARRPTATLSPLIAYTAPRKYGYPGARTRSGRDQGVIGVRVSIAVGDRSRVAVVVPGVLLGDVSGVDDDHDTRTRAPGPRSQ